MRAPWVLGITIAAATLGTLGAGAVRNDLRAGREFDPMLASLPARTAEITRITEVTSNGDSCRGRALAVLATELSVPSIREYFSDAGASGVAWSVPGGFRAAAADGRAIQPPGGAIKVLRQWAFLPPGVRRVVVFSDVPVASELDVRCL